MDLLMALAEKDPPDLREMRDADLVRTGLGALHST